MPASRNTSTARRSANRRQSSSACQPPPAAVRCRRGDGILIDPTAAAIAIDAGRREIADPAQIRRPGDGIAMERQHRIARLVRRRGAQNMRRLRHAAAASANPMPAPARARGAHDSEAAAAAARATADADIAQPEHQQANVTHSGDAARGHVTALRNTMKSASLQSYHGVGRDRLNNDSRTIESLIWSPKPKETEHGYDNHNDTD